MELRTTSLLDNDLNLHFYWERISRSWLILAFFCLAAVVPTAIISLLTTPQYKATAVVSIPAYLLGDAPITDLLQNDDIIQTIKAEQGMAPDVAKQISITSDKWGKSIFQINARARRADQAAAEANAWADASIQWLEQNFLNPNRVWLKKTQNDLNDADAKLLEFLEAHDLNQYSLIDIRIYEGMLAPTDFNYPSGGVPLELNPSVREPLRGLLRTQSNAAANYSDALDSYNKHQLQLQINGPAVLNRAQPPAYSAPRQPQQALKYSAFALLIGLVAGILVILVAGWWKDTTPATTAKP